MAEPGETVKRRRRWPWVVLAALLLIGVPVAWRLRPLTATERQLVGRWAESGPVGKQHFLFRPDRTFVMTHRGDQPLPQEVEIALGAGGKWRCAGGRLLLRFDEDDSTTILDTIRGLFRGTFIAPDRGNDDWENLRFDEDGNAWIGLYQFTRVVPGARVAR